MAGYAYGAPARLETLAFFRKHGISARRIDPICPDASTRRFFRLWLSTGKSAVAVLYPGNSSPLVEHHVRVALWAQSQGLPTPRLLLWGEGLLLMEDLGHVGLREALLAGEPTAPGAVLNALEGFQRAPLDAPNPPFDEGLFLRELRQFLQFAQLPEAEIPSALAFCRELSWALAQHPYRLCHRDFHLDNLLLSGGTVRAVDFQDLRAGPDMYDLASLLRERDGSQLLPASFLTQAACRLALPPGWDERFYQCAAQRGLKALGTFLKLAAGGRREYLRLVPEVAKNAGEALAMLEAPPALRKRVWELENLVGI
ncbi:MAG: phosphotransferase [Thermoanaerobaculaceae bacterium]